MIFFTMDLVLLRKSNSAVKKKLQQYDLENMPLLIPGRLPGDVLIEQVFQRAGQSLAVAGLPNLLLEIVTGELLREASTFGA